MVPSIVILGIIYALMNFIATKIKGKPIYDFLDWKTSFSLYVVFLILFSASFIYIFFCNLDEFVKSDLVNKRDKVT